MAKKAAAKTPRKKSSDGTRAAVEDLIGPTRTPTVKQARRKSLHKSTKKLVEKVAEVLASPAVPRKGTFLLRGKAVPSYPANLSNNADGYKAPAVKEWYKENHPDLYDHIYPVARG